DQRSLEVGEIARVQYLNAGVVLPIKGRDRTRTACIASISWRVEPKTEMIHLDRSCRRVLRGAGKRVVERCRCRSNARRNYKGFYTEAADKCAETVTPAVSLNVALIPRHAKWAIRPLDHEKIEICLSWQSGHFHVHNLDRSNRADFGFPARVRHTLRN